MGNQKDLKPKEAERRAKVQAAREAQKKAEKHKRTIIITTVVVLVLAVAGVIAAVVINGNRTQAAASAPAEIPAAYADGEAIVISDKGVGEKNPDLDDVTIYYSYSCHACAYLDSVAGPYLTQAAEDGAFNLLLVPVANVDYPWRGPATNAALHVAAGEPDKFIAFHLALSDYFNEKFNVESDDTVMANLEKSVAQVKSIAEDTGVSSDVIAKFGEDADAYTDITSEQWRTAEVDRGDDSIATPEIIYSGKRLTWTPSSDGQAILDEVMSQMKDLGYTDPRS